MDPAMTRFTDAHLEADDILPFGVGTCHLDGVIHSLRSTVGKEESRQAWGHYLQHPVQQTHLQVAHAL
jgi:hypothetical protein